MSESGSEQFEVYAQTVASGEIELGTARGLVDTCQLIESVDKSKYEPTEYRIRPAKEDDDPVAMTDGGVEQTGKEREDQPTDPDGIPIRDMPKGEREEPGTEQKKCRHCDATSRTRHIADWSDVLRHYLDEHPESDQLKAVINGTIVEVDCESCGEEFLSDLSVGSGRLGADLHCPGCYERDKLRGLFAQEVRATAAISSAVGGTLLPDDEPEIRTDGGEQTGKEHRPPCEAVDHMNPEPPESHYEMERRVCPNCRLYFDVGAESDAVFCSDACQKRHERGYYAR